MALHVVNEAKRCLNCKKPKCRAGCPINTNIPQMIQDFLSSRMDEAGQRLFENNPLSLVCSLVCDHEKQCEGHCILGKKGNPVHVSSIEHYISERYLASFTPPAVRKNGMRAAIIGSGPAGITIAIDLAKRGYDITIFESKDKIGGVLQYGIPEFRLPKTILALYKKRLLELGIKIRPNTTIGGALRIDDLFRDGYLAVFIGTGVWRPNALQVKGESLGHVHYAIDYLCSPDAYDLGKTVAVVGAGNAAMDAARSVLRHGAQNVTVYVRKSTVAASPREVEYAEVDGVKFHYCVKPVEFRPEGIVLRSLAYAEDGSCSEIEGSDSLELADSIIISIGQGPKDKVISTSRDIQVSPRGLILTDDQGATTRPGIFASGDVVRGAKTVVEAVHGSRQVADAMDQYMLSVKK